MVKGFRKEIVQFNKKPYSYEYHIKIITENKSELNKAYAEEFNINSDDAMEKIEILTDTEQKQKLNKPKGSRIVKKFAQRGAHVTVPEEWQDDKLLVINITKKTMDHSFTAKKYSDRGYHVYLPKIWIGDEIVIVNTEKKEII